MAFFFLLYLSIPVGKEHQSAPRLARDWIIFVCLRARRIALMEIREALPPKRLIFQPKPAAIPIQRCSGVSGSTPPLRSKFHL